VPEFLHVLFNLLVIQSKVLEQQFAEDRFNQFKKNSHPRWAIK